MFKADMRTMVRARAPWGAGVHEKPLRRRMRRASGSFVCILEMFVGNKKPPPKRWCIVGSLEEIRTPDLRLERAAS